VKFRTGKYAGLTVDHVKKIAPWYINWVRENRPEMLRDISPKKANTNSRSTKHVDDSYIKSQEQSFGMNFPTNNC
jgi:hypothetical protein|tara:strand:+ start:23 stop:247 length:225 start_codon:yes stop_codon:yes gene_type:complete